jgi:type VI secretion system protein ImpC
MTVEFKQIDDFHPDHLYQTLAVFDGLRQIRVRLCDPATCEQAVAEVRQASIESPRANASVAPGGAEESAARETDAATLQRLLGHAPRAAPAPPAPRGVDTAALIKGIVSPYIVPEAAPFQEQHLAWIDAAISERMRAVLHHPAFQALESVWRGVHWLVSNLELGEQLELHLLDATKEELQQDIESARGDLGRSRLYSLLVESGGGTLGVEPWSLLVGNYTFGIGSEDMALLASLGAIASQTGGPFLAAADPSLLGCRSLVAAPDPRDWVVDDEQAEERWRALRSSSIAPWLGLALPRVLLRLPYGKSTDRVEQFDFEELTPARDHETYLWGSPAIACALLVGRAFLARDWAMEPGDELEIGDLPAYSFEKDGERQLQACAEVCFTERVAEAILGRGLMPFLSYKNRNAIRLLRFQSVADPARGLAGPWSGREVDGVPV